jgi:23S rRNA (adenine1618-N6)-methyltransferase
LEEAQAGSRRKWNNLGKAVPSSRNPVANFSGKISELVYPGGEAAFIGKMIEESSQLPKACRWFTTLVSKEASLPAIFAQLERARAHDVHRLDLSQGQKKSRIVAWTFQS